MTQPRKLTPLRALELLGELNDTGWTESHRLSKAKEALTNHIKAALVPKSRKGRRR